MNTYKVMDDKIVELLRHSASSISQYAAARIEILQEQLAALQSENKTAVALLNEIKEYFLGEKFNMEIEHGYIKRINAVLAQSALPSDNNSLNHDCPRSPRGETQSDRGEQQRATY